jgi:starvation-inducible DNA-binding protein
MEPNIDIAASDRAGTIKILNTLLADEYVLYTKSRNYHWNVVSPRFNDLHKFFQAQYEQLGEIVDDVAERVRFLGGQSAGTLREFLDLTRLKESPGRHPEAQEMIADLLADHEAVIRALRSDLVTADEKYKDIGTNDFLTGLLQSHEKTAWMLRSFLEGR